MKNYERVPVLYSVQETAQALFCGILSIWKSEDFNPRILFHIPVGSKLCGGLVITLAGQILSMVLRWLLDEKK